jgi:hypothetical protein
MDRAAEVPSTWPSWRRGDPMSTVLVLRTCKPDMSSTNGFVWPESGPVAAPDWNPFPQCGHGLHGALWGCGDGSLLNWDPDAKWLVVEVEESDIVDLSGKVKYPRGSVLYAGDRQTATQMVYDRRPGPVIGLQITAGDGGTATAGYRGTATAGDRGTATAGDGGTATAGDRGTATAGDGGTATAGYRGTATAGDGGTVILKSWDIVANRYRYVIGYVGENGVTADTPYHAVDWRIIARVSLTPCNRNREEARRAGPCQVARSRAR